MRKMYRWLALVVAVIIGWLSSFDVIIPGINFLYMSTQ